MRIIDDLVHDLGSSSQRTTSGLSNYDPILHVTDGDVWTLGMSLSMWRFVFRRDADEVCQPSVRF